MCGSETAMLWLFTSSPPLDNANLFSKVVCQFTLPPAVCKSPGCSIFLTWHCQTFQFLSVWSSVFWRQPTVYTDSRELVLLVLWSPAPASEEGPTCNEIIWGGLEMVPVLPKIENQSPAEVKEREKAARSRFSWLKTPLCFLCHFCLIAIFLTI